jgi:hypothetical protein
MKTKKGTATKLATDLTGEDTERPCLVRIYCDVYIEAGIEGAAVANAMDALIDAALAAEPEILGDLDGKIDFSEFAEETDVQFQRSIDAALAAVQGRPVTLLETWDENEDSSTHDDYFWECYSIDDEPLGYLIMRDREAEAIGHFVEYEPFKWGFSDDAGRAINYFMPHAILDAIEQHAAKARKAALDTK